MELELPVFKFLFRVFFCVILQAFGTSERLQLGAVVAAFDATKRTIVAAAA